MILVDSATGSWELQSLIQAQGVQCDKTHLTFADAAFEGNGPLGLVSVGVERKRIHDMLTCIDDGRFVGHQLVGMRKMYKPFTFLILEGEWKPHDRSGLLMELFYSKAKDAYVWGELKPRTMYHKLRRYLVSVSLGGTVVLYSRDIHQTAFDICELFHWFQKPWKDHKSLLGMHRGYFWQRDGRTDSLMTLPSLGRKPSLVRRWAAELPGVGVKLSEDAARVFRTPNQLANANEADWMRVPGIGSQKAHAIVREVLGGVK